MRLVRVMPAALSLVGLAVLQASGGCRADRLVMPPDTTPPLLQVLSPLDTVYDDDGDKLVDLHVTWRDGAGVVDPTSIRLRSLRGVNGPAAADTNLLDVWRVEQLDTLGLVVHETIENLLHDGANQIEITVADTAGNMVVDTIGFTLPPAAFIRTILTGLPFSGLSHGVGAVICPDDRRLYATVGRRIVVVDADSLSLIGAVYHSGASDNLSIPMCVPGDPVLYVTERVERFDRVSMSWLPRAQGSYGAVGIVQSRADPNILYVGESIDGTIGIVDRAAAVRTGMIPLPPVGTPEDPEWVFDLAVLDGDTKLYATRVREGGILVVDPGTGAILTRIAVGGPTWPDLGTTDAFVLSADGLRLYVAVLDGDPRGVVEVSTSTDSVIRTLALQVSVPQELDLSPDGRRLFVTTQDQFAGFPSSNFLIDLTTWQVLVAFPRPRPAGQTRYDGGVAFHPTGKLIFNTHNSDIDVYLNRQ